MVANDKLEKDRTAAKNAVEEYVYEMREKLYEALAPFVQEAVSCIIVTLRQIWLHIINGYRCDFIPRKWKLKGDMVMLISLHSPVHSLS